MKTLEDQLEDAGLSIGEHLRELFGTLARNFWNSKSDMPGRKGGRGAKGSPASSSPAGKAVVSLSEVQPFARNEDDNFPYSRTVGSKIGKDRQVGE
jgi:hypothetical protein